DQQSVRLLDEPQGREPFDVSFANVLGFQGAHCDATQRGFLVRAEATKARHVFSCNALAAANSAAQSQSQAPCDALPGGRGSYGWEKGGVAARALPMIWGDGRHVELGTAVRACK